MLVGFYFTETNLAAGLRMDPLLLTNAKYISW